MHVQMFLTSELCVTYITSPFFADQSDTDLRHSLANMIAVTLGCPSHSNHLWYHMFAQEELLNTYITGFMVRELGVT